MATVDGGAIVGKALRKEGVEKAFVLCGGHTMPIFYGMRREGIEIIDMRHECAAVFAAIGYARASGKPAVVVTTAGPGVSNTVTGMMEAETVAMPVIQIGGAVPYSNGRDSGEMQDMSTLNVMKTCSKLARRVTSIPRIPEYVSMAFRHAVDLRPGPVYLEVPVDIAFGKVEEESVRFPEKARATAMPAGNLAAVEEAASLLAAAERPAAMIDDGARFSIGDDAGAIAELSDYLKMPVSSGNACKGLFGDESENPLLRTFGMAQADVALTLGCRFDFRLGAGRWFAKDAKVIQVHTDTRQIGFNIRADIGIVGGCGPVVRQLLEAVKAKRDKKEGDPWTGPLQKGLRFSRPAYEADGVPIHPGRCAGEVAKFLHEDGRDWNVCNDGGEAAGWLGGAWIARRPGQHHWSGPNGTIGVGAGQVIGTWAANRKPVLWYTGDGSFGFYAMEMDTMARFGIPVVCVISNDSAWGDIKLRQEESFPDEIRGAGHCNVDLAHMRPYEKMVEMWGGHGEMVTDPGEIIPAIRRAAANGKPSIINVEVDPEITIRNA